MDSRLLSLISHEVGVPREFVSTTIALLQDGGTVPFIARYRKEITGAMDETKVRAIQRRLSYYKELIARRGGILRAIEAQAKLTDELRRNIEKCYDRWELEDYYLPFKPKRTTKSVEAQRKGLEPLAEYFWNQEPDAWGLEEHADVCIDPEKGVATREEAIQGASDIIAEWISERSDFRKSLRELMWADAIVVSKVVPEKSGQKSKYEMYYDRRESISSIPSHRLLALRRGTKEGILTSLLETNDAKAAEFLLAAVISDRGSVFAPILEAAVWDSYQRLLRPALETELIIRLKERCDREAIRVFQYNLANLLLSPPGGPLVVIGLVPAGQNDCKLALVDERGKFLEASSINPTAPQNDAGSARASLKELVAKYGVRILAMGHGTGARETEVFVRQTLEEEKIENVLVATVNEAGASAYASSRIAHDEFPDLDNATRVAISIARRFQDPLAELVKVDPRAIGVGQYQHDVDQKELHRSLLQTVESCVNKVGVDPNTADFTLLRHVAGINDRLAYKMVEHRNSNGAFASRAALLSVPGMGEKFLQQAAGFLRIRNGENPLDRTAIHPESYPVVERMATTLGVAIQEMIENASLLSNLKLEEFVSDNLKTPTIQDIREELLKPGRDPRKSFAAPKFREDVKSITDIKEGMTLEGIVTNVTNFGAFVDIGVRQDGLVHLSQMSNRFIRDPREAVKVGDVVQVKVISVEMEKKRIGLSMKALLPPIHRRPKRLRPARANPQGPPSEQPVAAATEAAAPASPTTEVTRARGGDGSGHPVESASGRPPRRRMRRRGPPRDQKPEQPAETAQKPMTPEPTLQERIAMLQSKFRGIE